MSATAITEQKHPKPVVRAKDGDVYTNSRDVSAYFKKRHDHILRDIDNLLKNMDEIADLADIGGVPNFGETYFDIPIGGGKFRPFRTYDMDRRAFTVLAMGFTGPKALEFKLRYIAAFDAMAEKLKKQSAAAASIPFSPIRDEVELLNCHINKVAEARRIFGRAYARKVWEASPLATVGGVDVDECDRRGGPEDDGVGCLRHLSRWAAGNGLTLGEIIRAGFDDEIARRSLARWGIGILTDKYHPRFAMAEKSAALERVFEMTPWSDDWTTPLLAMDRTQIKLTTIGDKVVRAIHIPRYHLR